MINKDQDTTFNKLMLVAPKKTLPMKPALSFLTKYVNITKLWNRLFLPCSISNVSYLGDPSATGAFSYKISKCGGYIMGSYSNIACGFCAVWTFYC